MALASSMAWRGSEAARVVDAFKAASLPSLESRGEDGTRVAYLRSWTAQVRRAGVVTGWEKGMGFVLGLLWLKRLWTSRKRRRGYRAV
ncbi:hypothetical protein E2562_033981 [Oryza meyeriana var. granulata]|uniref:Uncharacterized protein n=1 Tax=Oryza meyeriana var. granulata TaxID=110450 RepID=A0A6G1ES68_9ORYZ|nr:hypothetical protein E2562_033981 [Oryza meyeriana var. granulata]